MRAENADLLLGKTFFLDRFMNPEQTLV